MAIAVLELNTAGDDITVVVGQGELRLDHLDSLNGQSIFVQGSHGAQRLVLGRVEHRGVPGGRGEAGLPG